VGDESLRQRLSVTLALVLLAAGALLAVSLQDFPRRLVEDYVLSRLHHDADLLYVRLLDAAPPRRAATSTRPCWAAWGRCMSCRCRGITS
jgi:hypothetical protein